MTSLYQKVTDQILIQLKSGTVPWVRPWSHTAGKNVPCNAVTNRPYSGVNTLLLWSTLAHNFITPRFLTFRQANTCGGRIRKGQNGFKVYFVKRVQSKTEDQNTDDTRKDYTVLKEYTVFNIDQCEGLPDGIVHPDAPKIYNHDTRCELADEFIQQTQADIRQGAGEAYYSPGHDCIITPSWEAFSSRDTYYNTLFHELTHWTGHKYRCDRDLKNRFGTRTYAAEELVAELGSSYLCAEFGFDTTVRSASYIDTWIELLKHDNRAIFTAASKASKAAEYLRLLALKEIECPSIVPAITSPTPRLPTSGHIQPIRTQSDIPALSQICTSHHLKSSENSSGVSLMNSTPSSKSGYPKTLPTGTTSRTTTEHPDDAICNSPTVYSPDPETSSEEVACRYPAIRLVQS